VAAADAADELRPMPWDAHHSSVLMFGAPPTCFAPLSVVFLRRCSEVKPPEPKSAL